MRFKNKVVIITGASGGIGSQMAHSFAEEGAEVINLDKVSSADVNVNYIKCDLSKASDIKSAIDFITSQYAQVDILINNACFSAGGILSSCDVDAFNDVLMVGVTAPYLLTAQLLPNFSKDACVVNIASTRGFMSQTDTESYSAAKGGILALTHALSISLAGKVRVNAVSPGWIHTDLDGDEVSEMDHAQHPVGRVGVPDDITRTVMFLCDSESGFITGENIMVDGGMSKLMVYHNDRGWSFSK